MGWQAVRSRIELTCAADRVRPGLRLRIAALSGHQAFASVNVGPVPSGLTATRLSERHRPRRTTWRQPQERRPVGPRSLPGLRRADEDGRRHVRPAAAGDRRAATPDAGRRRCATSCAGECWASDVLTHCPGARVRRAHARKNRHPTNGGTRAGGSHTLPKRWASNLVQLFLDAASLQEPPRVSTETPFRVSARPNRRSIARPCWLDRSRSLGAS
jgi:hypothetical protein